MAVHIRLTRVGATRRPAYRVIAIDSRRARDGRALEILGYYNPLTNPITIKLEDERIANWVARGARPSAAVQRLMKVAAEGPTLRQRAPVATEAMPEKPRRASRPKRAAAEPEAVEAAAESTAEEGTTEDAAPESAAGTVAAGGAEETTSDATAEAAAEAANEAAVEAAAEPAEEPAAEAEADAEPVSEGTLEASVEAVAEATEDAAAETATEDAAAETATEDERSDA